MPAFTAPRPASTTPRSTPTKAANGGQNARTRPRSAVPPSITAPPKVRAASPVSTASASAAASQFEDNREWELDRIRRLLYEQECAELKGQLEDKEQEIVTIRNEKTRITKSFWEGRTRAMALLATLTRKREELARARSGQHAGGKKASTLFSSFASASAEGSGAQPAAAAGAASAGEDSDLQTLQALTTIITELGNVSDSTSSSGSGGGGCSDGNDDAIKAGTQEGPGEEEGPNPAAASTTPEKVDKGEAAAAETPAAAITAAAAAATAACCSKCQGSMEEGSDAKEQAKAPTVDGETQTTATAAHEPPATAPADGAEFDLDLFKLKRQAAKLRDELAKKRFAEMALDVRLKETEEEAARLAEVLRAKEAVVESLRLELEEKDARLMDFVSRVHDIEVRLARVVRERDEKTAEAEAAVEAVRFYQAREELSVCDDASRRTSLASHQPLPGTAVSSRASSVSPSMAGGGVEEMKSGGGVGGQQGRDEEEEDTEVAKAVADSKGPSPAPSAASPSVSPTNTETDGSLGSVELVEAVTLEDDEGHQALRALHTPLERLLEEGMALLNKVRQQDHAVLAPLAMAVAALFALGLIAFLLRAAFGSPAAAPVAAKGGVDDAWSGSKRSSLLRLTPGGAPLLAGEYLSSCAPAVAEADPSKACYFLWNQLDGNLVLYRGFTPARHRGPIWSTNTLVVPGFFPERGEQKEQQQAAAPKEQQLGNHWGAANVTVWLTADRTLQLVDAPSGKVMLQRRAWRLPRELTPWPFGR